MKQIIESDLLLLSDIKRSNKGYRSRMARIKRLSFCEFVLASFFHGFPAPFDSDFDELGCSI